MNAKFGLYVTTCSVVLAIVSGCAPSEAQVARNAGPDTLSLPLRATPCSTLATSCETDRVALLSSPNNVVYTTRAEITPRTTESKDNDREMAPRSTAHDAAGPSPNSVLNE